MARKSSSINITVSVAFTERDATTIEVLVSGGAEHSRADVVEMVLAQIDGLWSDLTIRVAGIRDTGHKAARGSTDQAYQAAQVRRSLLRQDLYA